MTTLTRVSYSIVAVFACFATCLLPAGIEKTFALSIVSIGIYALWCREFRLYRASVTQHLTRRVPMRFRRYVDQAVPGAVPLTDEVFFVKALLFVPICAAVVQDRNILMTCLVTVVMIVIALVTLYAIIPTYREKAATAVEAMLLQISAGKPPLAPSRGGPVSPATSPEPSSSSPDAPHQ